MSHSIEHSNNFHLARRIAKIIAPDFRVFATENLEPGQAVLDLKRKTVEVGESKDELISVAAILFQVGHLRLKDILEFAEHNGNISTIAGDKRLINKMSKQGVAADQLASEWASQILANVYAVDPYKAQDLVSSYSWSEDEWKTYYSRLD